MIHGALGEGIMFRILSCCVLKTMRKRTTERVGDLSFSIFQNDVRLCKKEGGVGQTMQSIDDVRQAIH